MARKRRTLAVTAHHGHGRRNTWTQAKKRHELGKCYRKRDHSFKTCFLRKDGFRNPILSHEETSWLGEKPLVAG